MDFAAVPRESVCETTKTMDEGTLLFDESEFWDPDFNIGDPEKIIDLLEMVEQAENVTDPGRFRDLTDQQLMEIEECGQSVATKKNTKWAVKLFQDWSSRNNKSPVDFQNISATDLNIALRKFYAEAQPREADKRKKSMPDNQATEYHRSTLKNIRSGLNRHLHDLKRDIDIVKDPQFKPANNMFDAKLKYNVKHGLSRPVQHKPIISQDDLIKINTYLSQALNPVILRFRVWFDLSIHFVSRGLEFHQQLTLKSFHFSEDEFGEFVSITHETKQKNHQGGANTSTEESEQAEKRMYATGGENCPLKMLRLLIDKTDPEATNLFNHCNKDALHSPDIHRWYISKPVKQHQFSRFMGDICRNASCSRNYTPHCLRATAISAMSDAGFQLRHVMFMSGHKQESSLRSYNRNCSNAQKKMISNTLSSAASGNSTNPQPAIMCPESTMRDLVPITTAPRMMSLDERNPNVFGISSSSSHFMSAGFLSNSTFTNCTFNIGKPE